MWSTSWSRARWSMTPRSHGSWPSARTSRRSTSRCNVRDRMRAGKAVIGAMSGETDFENKKALVTGGSRGIGRAACLELARRGADVAFIYRNRDAEAEATAAEILALGPRALSLQADPPPPSSVGTPPYPPPPTLQALN